MTQTRVSVVVNDKTVLEGEETVDLTVLTGLPEEYVHLCQNCGQVIAKDADGWYHLETTSQDSWCRSDATEEGVDPKAEPQPQSVQPGVASFVNWLGISVEDDRATVSISVGDNRGAFTMSVWQRSNPKTCKQELMLSTPHPNTSFPHAELVQKGEGVYRILL